LIYFATSKIAFVVKLAQDFIRFDFTVTTIVLVLFPKPIMFVSVEITIIIWVLLATELVAFIFAFIPWELFTPTIITVIVFRSKFAIVVAITVISIIMIDSGLQFVDLSMIFTALGSSKILLFPFTMQVFAIIMGLHFTY